MVQEMLEVFQQRSSLVELGRPRIVVPPDDHPDPTSRYTGSVPQDPGFAWPAESLVEERERQEPVVGDVGLDARSRGSG